jgi:hypothetical protein
LIADIARATPRVHHWLPTREYGIVRKFLASSEAPGNLNIRLSAHMIGESLRVVPAGCTASAVAAPSGYRCPARSQGNACGACRACWDRTVPEVTYAHH